MKFKIEFDNKEEFDLFIQIMHEYSFFVPYIMDKTGYTLVYDLYQNIKKDDISVIVKRKET